MHGLQAILIANRKQYVKIGNTESSLKPVTCGVPQGSTLGPLLFLLYINDLPRSSKKLIFRIFADDTNSFYSSNNKSKRNPVLHAFVRKCSPQVSRDLVQIYFQFVGDLYRPVSWYCMYLAPLTGLLWIFLCDARINLASSMLRMLQDCQ